MMRVLGIHAMKVQKGFVIRMPPLTIDHWELPLTCVGKSEKEAIDLFESFANGQRVWEIGGK